MATMNISLPDQMKEWVEGRAATGLYSNSSDYVRDLIRRDQERAAAIAELQAIVDDAIASGVVEDFDPAAFLAELHAEADAETKDA